MTHAWKAHCGARDCALSSQGAVRQRTQGYQERWPMWRLSADFATDMIRSSKLTLPLIAALPASPGSCCAECYELRF
jgi:hypothetical protein